MIRIIPYYKTEIKAPLAKDELLEEFKSRTHLVSELSLRSKPSHRSYEGVIYNNGFDLRNAYDYSPHLSVCILNCVIEENENGSTLKLKYMFNSYGYLMYFLAIIISVTFPFIFGWKFILFSFVAFFGTLLLFNVQASELTDGLKKIVRE